jgi:hypothetical protein
MTRKPSIMTSTGRLFPLLEPESFEFKIEEIAHALSHICRYTGHTRHFYSVAQHSVYVASLVPAEYKMEALLHDASEAFLGDVASPLKALLPEYKAIEAAVEKAIARQYGLPFPLSPIVKRADMNMLLNEKQDLMPRGHDDWWPTVNGGVRQRVYPLSPEEARQAFMNSYYRYLEGHISNGKS